MFRLLRLVLFTVLAFVAGVLFERSNVKGLCATADGQWVGNTCVGSDIPNE